MDNRTPLSLIDIFPKTLSHLANIQTENIPAAAFPDRLAEKTQLIQDIPFLPDLARIELAAFEAGQADIAIPSNIDKPVLNATLSLLQSAWKGLAAYFNGSGEKPTEGDTITIVYRRLDSSDIVVTEAGKQDLLALKMVAEELDPGTTARQTEIPVDQLRQVLNEAAARSLIHLPASKLKRPPGFPGFSNPEMEEFRSSSYFTLQWHITQQCDLSCRHCYDRSQRKAVSLDQGLAVLDELARFSQKHHIQSQVSFTGGNPLLHPDFMSLYSAAAERGFMTAILGNPMPEGVIREMVRIQKPESYQISLEGLEDHNDYIRGDGSFRRAIEFLEVLRNQEIYSMVMLTLTRANMEQILPLAELLKERADLFTFNRLSMVGEGASLISADTGSFKRFLEAWTEAARDNPILGLKDSLFNIIRYEQGRPLLGGCTGFGCGAAFNFVSLLPDGEVHACRKFPSLIGNLHQNSLDSIYHSKQAEAYRNGSSGCRNCEIRPVCGGCLAVSYGFGQDVFSEIDPYCFRDQEAITR